MGSRLLLRLALLALCAATGAGGSACSPARPAGGSSRGLEIPTNDVRMPAVAGRFYPADGARLAADLDAYLAAARAPLGARPVALVSPHAGYPFCGAVMAEAWRQASAQPYGLIVLLGANHSDPAFDGVAVWTGGPWRTPLGEAGVDVRAAAALLEAEPAACEDRARSHVGEHSVEVLVPWAQRLFPGVAILPLVVASPDPSVCERFGRALAEVVRDRRPLLVASSDLAHYPRRADGRRIDQATLASIASLNPAAFGQTMLEQMREPVPGLSTCACGEAPILAAMAAARALGATAGRVVAYANSGDLEGVDTLRTVGYGAVAFTAAPDTAGRP